jgi:hypothetical protein
MQNLPSAVERIATFLGIQVDDDLRETVLQQCSKSSMAARRTQFDEHLLKLHMNVACGLQPNAGLAANQVSPFCERRVPARDGRHRPDA